MVWFAVLTGIFLLPFFSLEAFKASSLTLYLSWLIFLLLFSLRNKSYLKNRSILSPLLILMIIIMVTTILSAHPLDASGDALNLIFCVIVFIFVGGLGPARKRQIALMLMAASFFISVQALFQRFFYFDRIIPYLVSNQPSLTGKELFYIMDIAARRRVVSTFSTPNLLASYLVMINLLIFGYLFIYRKKRVFFILLALLIINTISLWFTGSFSGLASFVLGILLFFILILTGGKGKHKLIRRLFIPLAACVSVLFVSLFISRFFYSSGSHNLSFALEGRLQFWQTALRAIADRPFSFTGLGNFAYLYPIYAAPGSPESLMAHNLLLQLWVEIGPYGLLAFMVFITTFIFKAIRQMRPPAKNLTAKDILKTAALCSICAFLFHNMASFSFFILQTAVIWWILCALAVDP